MNWNLPDIVNQICLVLMFSALVVSTVTDIKRGEIPLFVFSLFGIACFSFQLIAGVFRIENILYGILVFGLYFVIAYFFQGGGGDAIFMSILAFVIRDEILIIMLIAHLLFLIPSFYAKMNKKREMLPFAPYVFTAYVIYYVYMFLVSS